MAKYIQLDFFKSEEQYQIDEIKQLLEGTKESLNKVRKGTYARLNELQKENLDLKQRLEIIEKNLCQGFYDRISNVLQ